MGMSVNDPILPDGYDDILAPLFDACAKESDDVIENPIRTQLPDDVNEGANCAGSNPVALRTRKSTASRLDIRADGTRGRLRILKFVQGGHLWPMPAADDDDTLNERVGFRNQDIDAADAVREFFCATDREVKSVFS